jgi:hypothetical protein
MGLYKVLEEYVNALKHRAGIYPIHTKRELEPTKTGHVSIPVFHSVELSVEFLRAMIDEVHERLLAIVSVVGAGSPAH